MDDYNAFKDIAKNLGFEVQAQTENNNPENRDAILISKNNRNCLFFLSEFTETEFANTLQRL